MRVGNGLRSLAYYNYIYIYAASTNVQYMITYILL